MGAVLTTQVGWACLHRHAPLLTSANQLLPLPPLLWLLLLLQRPLRPRRRSPRYRRRNTRTWTNTARWGSVYNRQTSWIIIFRVWTKHFVCLCSRCVPPFKWDQTRLTALRLWISPAPGGPLLTLGPWTWGSHGARWGHTGVRGHPSRATGRAQCRGWRDRILERWGKQLRYQIQYWI